jgi:hypothetical protein
MDPSNSLSPSANFPVSPVIWLPAPPLSRRGEEGLSSCLECPYHRAVVLTPPECTVAPVSLRRSMLSSLSGSELDFWGFHFSRPNLRLLSLRPDDLLTILKMALSIGFRNSVSLLSAIQATRLLTFASVGLSPTEHSSLSWTHFRTVSFPQSGWKAGISDGPSRRLRCFASSGLPPSFVHPAACNAVSSLDVEERGALVHHRSSNLGRFTPGALAPVRVMLSRSIIT